MYRWLSECLNPNSAKFRNFLVFVGKLFIEHFWNGQWLVLEWNMCIYFYYNKMNDNSRHQNLGSNADIHFSKHATTKVPETLDLVAECSRSSRCSGGIRRPYNQRSSHQLTSKPTAQRCPYPKPPTNSAKRVRQRVSLHILLMMHRSRWVLHPIGHSFDPSKHAPKVPRFQKFGGVAL